MAADPGRRGLDVSTGESFFVAGGGVDDSGRGCDWVQSAAGADCAADCPGGGFVSGSDPVSDHFAGADPDGWRAGNWVDFADAAGDAVVHLVQRGGGCDGYSIGPARGFDAVPVYAVAAV